MARVHRRHLGKTSGFGINEVVCQMNEKRLVTHYRPRTKHGMTQTQRCGLTNVDAIGLPGQDAAQAVQQVLLALLLQRGFEFRVGIEMVFDGPLAAAGDEHEIFGARRQCLFDGVLDEGLVDDGQHFLGARLGGWKETGATAGHGKNGGANDTGHGFVLERGRTNITRTARNFRDRPHQR